MWLALSVWTEDVFTEDNAYHTLAGAGMSALLAPGTLAEPWLVLPVVALWWAWGFLREQAQVGSWTPHDLFKRHKLLEASAWSFGAALVHVPLAFI